MTSLRQAAQGKKTIITIILTLAVQAARYFVGDIQIGEEILPAISLEELFQWVMGGGAGMFFKMGQNRGQVAKIGVIALAMTMLLMMANAADAFTKVMTDGVKYSHSCLKSNSAKSLTFKVSGAANVSFAIEEDIEGTVTQAAIVVDTSDELCGVDGTSFCVKYVSSDYMDSVKVTQTITGGAVESVSLRCGY